MRRRIILFFVLVSATTLLGAKTVCDSLLRQPIKLNMAVNPVVVDLGEEYTGTLEMMAQGDGKITFATALTKKDVENAERQTTECSIPPFYIMGSWKKITLPERRFRYLIIHTERRIELKDASLRLSRDSFIARLMQRMTINVCKTL